jgi:1,4-dihydroxy-2-naphthoate octaprenyltransferase
MANTAKAWISAARPRTLPLSISGILTGSAIAVLENAFNWTIFGLAIATTLSFQILSNFANDYGDGIKGTDNDDRLGPQRAIQSGAITDKALKKGMIINAVVSLIIAFLLIGYAFDFENFAAIIIYFILAILSIVAAIKYTVGNNAYGYSGFGDIFVFIFFGWVSVIGVFYLYDQSFEINYFLPASAIGMLSVAVLNLNNMRDRESDLTSKKMTLAIQLGEKGAKLYHSSLITISLVLLVIFYNVYAVKIYLYSAFIVYVPLVIHLIKVIKNKHPKYLDLELKKVALSCFGFSLLFFVCSFWI